MTKNFLTTLKQNKLMTQLVFSLLFISLHPVQTYAADNIKIYLPSGIPPYTYLGDDKKPKGIDINIINEISKRWENNITIGMVPWNRLMHDIADASVDGVVFSQIAADGVNKSAKEEGSIVETSISMFTSSVNVYVKKDSPLNDETLDVTELKNIEVGMLSGWVFEPPFKSYNKQEVLRDEQLINLLEIDRVEAIIMEDLPKLYHEKKMGIVSNTVPIHEIIEFNIVVGLSSKKLGKDKTKKYLKQINSIVKEMQDDGFIDKLFKTLY